MNIQEIMKQISEQSSSDFTTMYRQKEMLDSAADELKRHEMAKNGVFLWAVPMQLQLPFNPFNMTDTNFSSKKPFKVMGSAKKFVLELKAYLNENAEKEDIITLKRAYAKLGGMTLEEYDTSDIENITAQDVKVFAQYRMPNVPSLPTQKIKTEDAGQFGVEKLTPLRKDQEGNILPECFDQVLYQLLTIEQDIRKEKFAEFALQNPGKNLSSDAKVKRKAIKESIQITYPKDSGVLIVYEFPCDAKEEKLKDITSDDLSEYLTYLNCGTETLKKLEKRIGKKKDTELDYMLLKVGYGDGKGDKTEELNLYSSREYENVPKDDEDYGIASKIEDFDEKITEAIDAGLSGGYEKAAKRSVYKYHAFSDQEALGYFFTRFKDFKGYVTRQIFNKYSALIEKVNMEVYKELSALDAKNALPVSFAERLLAENVIVEEDLDALDTEDKVESIGIGSDNELEQGSELEELAAGK